MTRAYIRLDPGFDEHKEHYPDGPYAALITVLCLAEHQPDRGRFRNERFLRALMGKRGRHLAYLLAQGDVVILDDGRLYVDGWDEWQEGDFKVADRVSRIRVRRHGEPDVTPQRHAPAHKPVGGAIRTAAWRLRTRVFERDNYTCRYCGIDDYPREWLVLEHVIPDGPTTEENLVTACRGCNKRKGPRTPEEAGMPLRDVSPRGGDADGDASRSDVTRLDSRAVPSRAVPSVAEQSERDFDVEVWATLVGESERLSGTACALSNPYGKLGQLVLDQASRFGIPAITAAWSTVTEAHSPIRPTIRQLVFEGEDLLAPIDHSLAQRQRDDHEQSAERERIATKNAKYQVLGEASA